MGLDQYLYKIHDNDGLENVTVVDESNYEEHKYQINDDKIQYWRKSNWVHRFFDDLCEQKAGHELGNCEYIIITQRDFNNLLKRCREVRDSESIYMAEDLLPTMPGFFFGSTEYDDWYFDDIKDTIKSLEQYEAPNDSKNLYAYYAWW